MSAIFDIGTHRPHVAGRQQERGSRGGVRQLLECDACSLLDVAP